MMICTVAAAIVFTSVLVLNTNTAFAEKAKDIPVIGKIAEVFTFRSYEKETTDYSIAVDIPTIEMISNNTKGLSDSINKEIFSLCEEYANNAVAVVEEYKKAFLETGGTPEEWEAHNIKIQVRYEVKAQTNDYISLVVMGTQDWSSAYNDTKYYNISLKDGKLLTLNDILGDNYKDIVNASIQSQINLLSAKSEIEFFPSVKDGFQGISENQKFYLNTSGNPVIVFEKYEIAPGAYGAIEFEINTLQPFSM